MRHWLTKLWRIARRHPGGEMNTIRIGVVLEINRASRDEHGDLGWFDELSVMPEQMLADEARRVVDLCVRRCDIRVTRGVVLPTDKPGKAKGKK